METSNIPVDIKRGNKFINFTNQLKELKKTKNNLENKIKLGSKKVRNTSDDIKLKRTKSGVSRYAYAAIGYKNKDIDNAKQSYKTAQTSYTANKAIIKTAFMEEIPKLQKFKSNLKAKIDLLEKVREGIANNAKYQRGPEGDKRILLNIEKIKRKIEKVDLLTQDIHDDIKAMSIDIKKDITKW